MKKGPTNPELLRVISQLRKTKKKGFLLLANKLETGTRRRPEVNLWKLDKHTKEGDFAVVPGKVLSQGELTHKIELVAFSVTKAAQEKMNGSKTHSFDYLIKEKPKNYKVIT